MTAADIMRAAQEDGLVVSVNGNSLEVRGPEEARLVHMPRLAVAAKAIQQLIAAGTAPRVDAKCSGYHPTRVCPACGIIHGKLAPDPCSQCDEDTWVTSVVGTDGARICARCLRS